MDITHKKGTTFLARNYAINLDGSPLELEAVSMHIRRAYGSPVVYEMDITITGTGTFTINEQLIDIAALTYVYDIRFVYGGGIVKNWVSGNFIVENNVTAN